MNSALFVGRFQPFHLGHLEVVKQIVKENDRAIIAIGSAEQNYLCSDPLTAGERHELIEASLKDAGIKPEQYCIIPIRNIHNYGLWVHHVNLYVPRFNKVYTGSGLVKSCFNVIPNPPEIVPLERQFEISATKVRDAIKTTKNLEKLVSPSAIKLLQEWKIAERLNDIENSLSSPHYNPSY